VSTSASLPSLSRRRFLLGASAVGAAAMLPACGNDDSGAEGGDLRFQSFQPADVVEVWEPQFSEFKSTNGSGVRHEYIAKAQQNQSLLTLAASGTLPDVALISADSFPSLSSRGLLEPLDQAKLKDYQINDGVEVLRNLYTYDGKPYGIGTDLDMGLLFYNEDLFTAAGLTPPTPQTTWDEMRQMARTLTKGSGAGKFYGLDVTGSGPYLVLSAMAWAFGGQLIDAKAKKVTISDGGGRRAVELFTAMQGADGSIPPPNSEGATIANGRVAMGVYGAWAAYYVLKDVKFKWGLTKLPRADSFGTYGSGSTLVIFKSSKNKAKAAEFVNFFMSRQLQLQRASDFGWTPPTTSVLAAPEFGTSGRLNFTPEQRTVITETAAQARPLVLVPEQVKLYQAVTDALGPVANGQADAAKTIQALQDGWQSLIS
jgi:ABC-type glycerol-3-phosphate transport system substrate-binding protein